MDINLGELLRQADYENVPRSFPHLPCIIPDSRYPAMIIDSNTALVWCQLDEDLNVRLLSPIGDYSHEVLGELRDGGVDSFFSGYRHPGYWEVTRAAKLGLTHSQPFLVKLYARHYVNDTPNGLDYDCALWSEIKWVSPLPQDRIAAQWEPWGNYRVKVS
jgi:hypothetical protein